MIGYVVRHRQLGLGKIESAQNRAFSIRFVASGQLMPFGYAQFAANGSLTREVLGLGSRCSTRRGECVIERVARRPTDPTDPYSYAVSFETGEAAVLSEAELDPIPGGESADPQVRLSGLQLHPYPLFASRESLRRTYARMLRDTAGLRALLGSRVDLRPHQAFVAGTVLLEPRRRFILADEVGLGKTIEAGIVIHDLLAQKSDARILVLCPGTLTQQWLCELYAKFGGHLFTLLDLHDPETVDWAKARLVISSTTLAALRAAPALENATWDMVIVDEVHHLLTMPALYAHVERLSRNTPAILLLSAIPAHERSDELLRLLALLEPERYGAAGQEARARFATLHEQQPAIGKGLRVLERRIAALEANEVEVTDACVVARRLLETSPLNGDRDLADRLGHIEAPVTAPAIRLASVHGDGLGEHGVVRDVAVHDFTAPLRGSETPPASLIDPASQPASRVRRADDTPAADVSAVATVKSAVNAIEAEDHDTSNVISPGVATREEDEAQSAEEGRLAEERRRGDAARALRRWSHDVADRYRLSRRILRNRRARLVEQQQIEAIARRVDLRPYAPHRLELEASDALEHLLRAAFAKHQDAPEAAFLAPFARVAWQALSSPAGLADLLSRLAKTTPSTLNARGLDFLTIGSAVGYTDWTLYRDLLLKAARGCLSGDELQAAVYAANRWRDAGVDTFQRLHTVRDLVAPLAPERPKLILFAGYPGLAEELRTYLESYFGANGVASFRTEQSMEEKEASALRFQQDPAVWLLVSDESGGEGRNFQFASALVHVDTPWHVARVEQRVGRLDRLGRERVQLDVLSSVIYSDASVEAGLVQHFDEALGVYRRSISGLEFALRDVEHRIVTSALTGGVDTLAAEVPRLATVVESERTRDDGEAVLDEASYEASAAARFRAITRSERMEESLERAVFDYMRQLTEGRGARKLDTAHGPGAVIRFQPEKTCFGALPVDGTGTEFLAGNFDGTFRRQVAQQAPRLHFFNVSDPLFNAVIGSLDRQATGRTFGIELTAPGRTPWIGLECRFIPRFDAGPFASSAGLRNRLDALFIPKPIAVLVDLHGGILPIADADAVVVLRRRAEYNQHGQTWWDLGHAASQVKQALDADTWPDTVAALVQSAEVEARRRLAEQLDRAIATEQRRIAALVEVLSEAGARGDDEGAQQAAQYRAYAAALPGWTVALDAVGIISVNGRLRVGRLS